MEFSRQSRAIISKWLNLREIRASGDPSHIGGIPAPPQSTLFPALFPQNRFTEALAVAKMLEEERCR
jgi:hypothetical protein